jgi:ABC-type amino acid transport substrate-binding protein
MLTGGLYPLVEKCIVLQTFNVKQTLLKMGSILLAFSIWFAACSNDQDGSLRRVEKAGRIRIAMNGDYPPFSYYNEKKELEGFDVEVARLIADRLGVALKPITVGWSDKVSGLLDGEFDAILGCVAVSESKRKDLRFSDPYYHSTTRIMVREGTEFNGPKDLARRSVGAVSGTIFEKEAERLGAIDLRLYSGHSQAFRDLHNGTLDALVTDQVVGDNAMKAGKFHVRFLGPSLGNRSVSIGLRKEDKVLSDKIERVLEEMRKEGLLQNLIRKVAQCEYNCAMAFKGSS